MQSHWHNLFAYRDTYTSRTATSSEGRGLIVIAGICFIETPSVTRPRPAASAALPMIQYQFFRGI